MSRQADIAYRLRWLLLGVGLVCMAGGVAFLLAPWILGDAIEPFFAGPYFTPIAPGWLLPPDPLTRQVVGYFSLLLGVLIVLQWLFLSPGKNWRVSLAREGRPMRRSVLVAGLMAAMLTVGLIATLLEVPDWWQGVFVEGPGGFEWWPAYVAIATAWVIWTWVFWIYLRQGDEYTRLGKLIRGLIAGSILELLIAVPVQAWVARRDDCWCARGSYTGMVFSITVLTWAFGPGLVLLFMREKYRREKFRLCPKCGYDLRGTLAAGRSECPECGAAYSSEADSQRDAVVLND